MKRSPIALALIVTHVLLLFIYAFGAVILWQLTIGDEESGYVHEHPGEVSGVLVFGTVLAVLSGLTLTLIWGLLKFKDWVRPLGIGFYGLGCVVWLFLLIGERPSRSGLIAPVVTLALATTFALPSTRRGLARKS